MPQPVSTRRCTQCREKNKRKKISSSTTIWQKDTSSHPTHPTDSPHSWYQRRIRTNYDTSSITVPSTPLHAKTSPHSPTWQNVLKTSKEWSSSASLTYDGDITTS